MSHYTRIRSSYSSYRQLQEGKESNVIKGATSPGFRRFFVISVQKLVVGNLTHEKHYLLTSKGRYDLNLRIEI